MKTVPTILLTLAVAVPATWFATRQFAGRGAGSAPTLDRKPLYYQSAMHPWIKSDKPGRCTLCGMELTPVYEGDPGFDSTGGDVVPLSQSMIQVLHVQTAEARVQPLTKTLRVAGIVENNTTRLRALAAYIPGRIQKLHVNFMGAEVAEGEPLADFYSPMLLQAEREYRTLSGDLRAAAALRLIQMGLTPAQIEALPQKPGDELTSQILSPIGGTVIGQSVVEGQYVREGETLFEIADFSTMWFQFQAYEQDLPWIKPGLNVDITTPSHPGMTFPGRVTFIDPNVDDLTRSTQVRVELDNPLVEGRRLWLRQLYGDGLVHLDAPEVLAIPRSAVIETGPEAVVYVDLGGGAYARRTLEIGRRGDSLVEAVSGIAAGDQVVVNGNLLLDGQAEMNRAFAPPTSTRSVSNAPASALPELTGAQQEPVKDFLAFADALAASLAADNLGEYNTHSEKSHEALAALLGAFPQEGGWRDLIRSFEAASHLGKAADLREARKAFHPFSNGVVALALALRRGGEAEFDSLKVFRCPMTKDAFDGAPNRAEWMQMRPAVRNPYFGEEMLECGVEVKP